MNINNVLFSCLAASCLFVTGACQAETQKKHDYPTIERVTYVENCVEQYKAKLNRRELIYKCSCAIDEIAVRLNVEDFEGGLASVLGKSIAGERGGQMRDSVLVDEMAKQYKTADREAKKACYIK